MCPGFPTVSFCPRVCFFCTRMIFFVWHGWRITHHFSEQNFSLHATICDGTQNFLLDYQLVGKKVLQKMSQSIKMSVPWRTRKKRSGNHMLGLSLAPHCPNGHRITTNNKTRPTRFRTKRSQIRWLYLCLKKASPTNLGNIKISPKNNLPSYAGEVLPYHGEVFP